MTDLTRRDEITSLPLSVRAIHCLNSENIHTIGELLAYPPERLLSIRNMGEKTAREVRSWMQTLKDGSEAYRLVEKDAVLKQREPEPMRGYLAGDGSACIWIDEKGNVLGDLPIAALPISERAKNRFSLAGFAMASELVGMSFDELTAMPSMGEKTAWQTSEYLAKMRVAWRTKDGAPPPLLTQTLAAYGGSENVWLRAFLRAASRKDGPRDDVSVNVFYEQSCVRKAAKRKILRILEKEEEGLSPPQIAVQMPPHLETGGVLRELLSESEREGKIEWDGMIARRRYPTVREYIASIEEIRALEILSGRLAGMTLEQIGGCYGVTRERIRQVIKKWLQKRPYLQEDRYLPLFERYLFSKQDVMLAFDVPQETYYYLEMINSVPSADKLPLEAILTDGTIDVRVRKQAERAVFKHYVLLEGAYVKKSRPELVRHYVRTRCTLLTAYRDFVDGYHAWLAELGLAGEASLRLESKAYENKLSGCEYTLWHQWKHFRYYPIEQYDFSELLCELDLEQYRDVEFSTLRLFRDHAALMRRYDIRDEYELHNLLKKIWPQEASNVTFQRMPNVKVGHADVKTQVYNLLLQYAPIGADELAMRYEETYGVKAATVRGNYFGCIDPYYYNGSYRVDYVPLPEDVHRRLEQILTGDFYTISRAEALYRHEFPNAENEPLNPYTLKSLGFHVYPGYSGYIVKNTFSGAVDYFQKFLTGEDRIDLRKYPQFRNITTFATVRHRLCAAYRIVEYLPQQYVNERHLRALGITKDELLDYCRAADEFCGDEYVTILSLRKKGFSHSLDRFGFDEWFYASILMEDTRHFSGYRIGGTRMFRHGASGGDFVGMLTWLLRDRDSIRLEALLALLEAEYGIRLPKDKMLRIAESMELYYDPVEETIYRNGNPFSKSI